MKHCISICVYYVFPLHINYTLIRYFVVLALWRLILLIDNNNEGIYTFWVSPSLFKDLLFCVYAFEAIQWIYLFNGWANKLFQ